MAVGDIVRSGVPSMPEAFPGKMGPTVAMREALAAYLMTIKFSVDGGSDPRDSDFHLNKVLDHFPRPEEKLDYPCASIGEVDSTDHDQCISPTPLEDTLGSFDHMVGWTGEPPQTCLWVTGEAETVFQVDFWADKDPDRQAIEGALSSMFSPEEGRSAIVVEGPDLYFGQSCEFAIGKTRFDDSGMFSQRNERRLRCVVAANCAIVSLRRATLIQSIRAVACVHDPVDPGPYDEQLEE